MTLSCSIVESRTKLVECCLSSISFCFQFVNNQISRRNIRSNRSNQLLQQLLLLCTVVMYSTSLVVHIWKKNLVFDLLKAMLEVNGKHSINMMSKTDHKRNAYLSINTF